MAEEQSKSRRKVLSSTVGVGSLLTGASGIAAGSSGDRTSGRNAVNNNHRRKTVEKEFTEKEIEKALSEAEVSLPGSDGDVSTQSAKFPDDLKVYYGEDKNAEVPTGQPYKIESYEEYLNRDVPTGFNPTYGQVRAQGSGTEFLYHKEEFGTLNIAGHSIDLAAGAGITLNASGLTTAEATISADVYIGGFSMALSSFSIGYGVTDEGLCIERFQFKHPYLRKIDVEACVTAGLTEASGDKFKVPLGFDVTLCVDPCPGSWNCAGCKGVGFGGDAEIPNPL